jgi:hypothetical protein
MKISFSCLKEEKNMKYLGGNTHSLIFLINPFFIPYNYEELEENKMKFNNF